MRKRFIDDFKEYLAYLNYCQSNNLQVIYSNDEKDDYKLILLKEININTTKNYKKLEGIAISNEELKNIVKESSDANSKSNEELKIVAKESSDANSKSNEELKIVAKESSDANSKSNEELKIVAKESSDANSKSNEELKDIVKESSGISSKSNKELKDVVIESSDANSKLNKELKDIVKEAINKSTKIKTNLPSDFFSSEINEQEFISFFKKEGYLDDNLKFKEVKNKKLLASIMMFLKNRGVFKRETYNVDLMDFLFKNYNLKFGSNDFTIVKKEKVIEMAEHDKLYKELCEFFNLK